MMLLPPIIIDIRPMKIEDSSFLFWLRNHKEIRKWCRTSALISPEDHHQWMQQTLDNQDIKSYIVLFNNMFAGRLAISKMTALFWHNHFGDTSNWEIHFAMNPEFMGQGWSYVFTNAFDSLAKKYAIDNLLAQVKKTNTRSLGTLKKAGYNIEYQGDPYYILQKRYGKEET